jgi:hypothetical protein
MRDIAPLITLMPLKVPLVVRCHRGHRLVSRTFSPLLGSSRNQNAKPVTRLQTPCHGCRRTPERQKQSATRRSRATITQVGNDSRADVWRRRHPRSLPTLSANENLAGTPVDIIQGERRDFVGPQAEPSQHHQDGIVPSPHGGCSVAAIEDFLNVRGGEIGRQARDSIA